MSCIEALLAKTATRVEPEVQQRLRGFLGQFIRAYLPQTWVFQTNDGTASLRVDANGHATAIAGAAADPDVTVEIAHDRLKAALEGTSKTPPPASEYKVTPHTKKGKAAFDLLRQRVGL